MKTLMKTAFWFAVAASVWSGITAYNISALVAPTFWVYAGFNGMIAITIAARLYYMKGKEIR